jgi:hypothetical protein
VKKFKVLVRLITEEDFQNYLTTWNSLEQLGTAKIKLYFYLQKKVCQSIKDSFCTAFLKAVLFFAQLFYILCYHVDALIVTAKRKPIFFGFRLVSAWFPIWFPPLNHINMLFKGKRETKNNNNRIKQN